MLARVITLRFDPVLGSFDDGPLRNFLKDKEVLSIRDHFFVKNEVPYLAVLVTYYPHRPETTAPLVAPKKQPDRSWRDLVTAEELPFSINCVIGVPNAAIAMGCHPMSSAPTSSLLPW